MAARNPTDKDNKIQQYDIHHYIATLFQTRKSVINGNIELYSLNGSFVGNEWWEIGVYPTSTLDVRGYVRKVVNGEVVPTFWSDALSALKGNFLCVQDVQSCEEFKDKFTHISGKHITFTLRVGGIESKQCLANYDNKKSSQVFEGIAFNIETGPIIRENQLVCVYGLITVMPNANASDVDESPCDLDTCWRLVISVLKPSNPVELAHMSYCLNEDGWREFMQTTLKLK